MTWQQVYSCRGENVFSNAIICHLLVWLAEFNDKHLKSFCHIEEHIFRQLK